MYGGSCPGNNGTTRLTAPLLRVGPGWRMWQSPGPCSPCCSPASPSRSPAESTQAEQPHLKSEHAGVHRCATVRCSSDLHGAHVENSSASPSRSPAHSTPSKEPRFIHWSMKVFLLLSGTPVICTQLRYGTAQPAPARALQTARRQRSHDVHIGACTCAAVRYCSNDLHATQVWNRPASLSQSPADSTQAEQPRACRCCCCFQDHQRFAWHRVGCQALQQSLLA
jgi:hypothetical protein